MNVVGCALIAPSSLSSILEPNRPYLSGGPRARIHLRHGLTVPQVLGSSQELRPDAVLLVFPLVFP